MNPSTWGWGEYVAIGGGLWIANSLISDLTRVGGAVGSGGRKAYRKTKRAAKGAGPAIAGVGSFILTAGAVVAAWWAYNQYTSGGLGDYQAQGWATPQVLQSPVSSRSSALAVPIGF
jgi:hypothetical protein